MKQNKLIILLVAFVVITFSATSCSKESRLRSLNTPFLDFVDDDYQSSLSKENALIVCKALDRAGLIYTGSKLNICAPCAKEINVSDRLFNYILSVISNTNNSDISIVDTKNGDYPYSCVAYTLSHLAGAPDFTTINDWIVNEFHLDGFVPSDKLEYTMERFFGDCFGKYTTSTIPDNIEWTASRTFGYYITLSGYGHMVNIVGRRANGDFLVQDFSSDTVETRNVFSSSMVKIYQSFFVDSLAVEF